MKAVVTKKRCAVYTRVSTDERLDQSFNSLDAQREAAGAVLSERDARRQYQQALDEATAALEKNGQNLDITTEAGRENQAALDGITESTWSLIDSMRENGATTDAMRAVMVGARDDFVNMAIAEGMGADEANRLADELGLTYRVTRHGPVRSLEEAAAARGLARLIFFLRGSGQSTTSCDNNSTLVEHMRLRIAAFGATGTCGDRSRSSSSQSRSSSAITQRSGLYRASEKGRE